MIREYVLLHETDRSRELIVHGKIDIVHEVTVKWDIGVFVEAAYAVKAAKAIVASGTRRGNFVVAYQIRDESYCTKPLLRHGTEAAINFQSPHVACRGPGGQKL